MRILAIRGRNLASLEAEFELDLAHGALGGAGVFAIVGSTGAGKSTLLDALCVALFDRTPRLGNHSRVQVGRGPDDPTALGAHDVRTLLRRGAASGWAEVDFEAGDGRRYRARWAVRRARNHSDGTMQDASITLIDLDGDERLGGTKTETLKAIHARLGLSFDQFRRSALLAQGEFATFLRAEGKDRSELLERMTGTEIYSRLSIAAHARAAAAEQRVRDARATAGAIAILPDDDRAAAERARAAAVAAAAVARAAAIAAEHAARWIAIEARHAREGGEADAAATAATDAVTAAHATRDELAVRRRAEALRADWDAAARADRQAIAAEAERSAALTAAGDAVAGQGALVARRARLAVAHAPIVAARAATGVAAAHAPIVAARAASGSSSRDKRASGTSVRTFDQLLAAAEAIAADATWLTAHAALAPEIAAWPAVDARFGEHAAAAAAIVALEAAIVAHAAQHAARTAERAAATVACTHAAARLADAQRAVADIQHKRGVSLDDAGKAEDAARRRCADVEQLGTCATDARAAADQQATIAARRAELAAAEAADLAARTAAIAARDHAATVRDERARVAAELRRVASYDHARAELVDGEPCPLCGAAEHPWHGRGAFDALIADAETALVAIGRAHDAEVAVLATIDARTTPRDRERLDLDARAAATTARIAAAATAWRDQLAALGELALVGDPADPAAAELARERLATARARLADARDARSHAVAIAKASEDAQAHARARQAELDAAVAAQRALDAELAGLAAERARVHGELAGRVAHRAEIAAALDAAIARWLGALPASGAGAIGTWHPAAADRDPAEVVAARAALASLVHAWQRRVAAIAPVDAALTAALAALDDELRAADRAVAETAARRADCVRRRDQLAGERDAAIAALDATRVAAGFGALELAALLAASPARVAELAAQLAALDRARDLAGAVAAERRRLAAEHAATRPPSLAEAERVGELTAEVARADQHAAALAATLAADADARTRRDAALAALATAEAAAEVDRVLGAAIGSHDGKLFRSFAQSLTLDSLLAVANAHLDELAPRYQLQRVPRHDLELQVIDRDLGAEVRSVQSLSGGESFLVSLALALGLSSMSAHDVKVRTLLIDEGFGTLDPASLDAALHVLDALQYSGRQVGVISHMPALIDRVGAHVRVIPRGGGRSDVIVGGA